MIEERDCRKCISKGCIGKAFYSWGEIRFCRFQMIWLIEHLVELGEGNWPDNPDGSSYVDPTLRSKSFRNEAYFCKPVGLVAEVMKRLKKVGRDGTTLMEEIHSGLREYSLLSSVAKNALNYISIFDWRKRKTSYKDWKSKQKQREGRKRGEIAPMPIEQRISCRISSAMSNSLRVGGKGGLHWEKAVGYNRAQLMCRLELQFRDGMSWDNYGEWHIDHIVPISHFRFNSIDASQFRECWALKNLQPLLASENCRKSNKYGRLIVEC